MAAIFISYRRADSGGWAGRLSDSLKAELGRVNIFRDIEDIPPGIEFDKYIQDAVASCAVLIALIGPQWLTILDKNGLRRIDDPKDFTHLEIMIALNRNVRVIPALVGGAQMPDPEELPVGIKALARRHAYELSDTRWRDDCSKLAEVLRPSVAPKYHRQGRVMARIVSPRLFISYSRRDTDFVVPLSRHLRERGFQVFLDTSDIDPGDNFVKRLSGEIERTTVVLAVLSDHYISSQWARAELYYATALQKITVPLLLSNDSLSQLDEPLQRLLRDVQFVATKDGKFSEDGESQLANLLLRARRRYCWDLFRRFLPVGFIVVVFSFLTWWAVTHSNDLREARLRDSVFKEIVETKGILQRERISTLAKQVTGDKRIIGDLLHVSKDPAQADVARLNAIALGSELLKGYKGSRWYIEKVNAGRLSLEDVSFVNTSFLGGSWNDVQIKNATFSGVFWSQEKDFRISASGFLNVQFFGGEMEGISAVDVTFINAKFRGTVIDTTNFAKVRFITEEPATEGSPIITPDYTLFERSVIISKRTPPERNVVDLTLVGDDVTFDRVLFVDSRLDGWFRPEWFRNSNFVRCELPPSLTKQTLERSGNTVEQ